MLLNPWQDSDSLEVESLALVVEENRYCHLYMCTEITVLVTLVWYKGLLNEGSRSRQEMFKCS